MASLQQQRNETKKKILQKMDGYNSASGTKGAYLEDLMAKKGKINLPSKKHQSSVMAFILLKMRSASMALCHFPLAGRLVQKKVLKLLFMR